MNNFQKLLEIVFGTSSSSLPDRGILSSRSLFLFGALGIVLVFYQFYKIFFSKNRSSNESLKKKIADLERERDELKQQMQEIQESANRRTNYISSLFSAMEDGVILFDTNGSIILFNESAQRLAQIDSQCFFDLSKLTENDIVRTIKKSFPTVMSTAKTIVLKAKTRAALDVEIGMSAVYSKYRDGKFLGFLAILKDVTEREKVERIRKEFISNVSHEFRTPLTLISGFIETLKLWDNLPASDRNRSLEILEIETGRLSKLISELLLLSEIEHHLDSQTNLPIDIEKSIKQAVESLKPAAGAKHHVIIMDSHISSSLIYGNESWFYHAFRNVLENAIKYTPEQGEIYITAKLSDAAVCVCVKDNGIGIAKSEQEKIFERFYRVEKGRSSRSGGSGIGLAIVRDIMSLFGGSVHVDSELGKGATFTLEFPLRSAQNIENSEISISTTNNQNNGVLS